MKSNLEELENRVQVRRVINATPEQIYEAWTTPEIMKQWLGGENCHPQDVEADARVGGAFKITMHTERGRLEAGGVYRELSPPSKLVYTWNWKGDPEMEFGETVVTVELKPQGARTEVVITHEGFPTPEIAAMHSEGWSGSLVKLERLYRQYGGDHRNRPGALSWCELMTTDPEAACEFYKSVFGWEFETMPMCENMTYHIAKAEGNASTGGIMAMPPNVPEGTPPRWGCYITVKDADAVAARVEELGGKILMPPMDFPDVGRGVTFQDPQGAVISAIAYKEGFEFSC